MSSQEQKSLTSCRHRSQFGLKRCLLLLLASLLGLNHQICVAEGFSSIRRDTSISASTTTAPNTSSKRRVLSPFRTTPKWSDTLRRSTRIHVNGNDKTSSEATVNSSGSKSKYRAVLVTTFVSSIAAAATAAKMGLSSGAYDATTGLHGVYTDSMIVQDVGCTVLAAALAYALVKAITFGYTKGFYGSKVSRKLSHLLSSPLFVLVYPLFSAADGARYFAACVTTLNIVRLYLAGTGWDTTLASSVSRSGDKSEALGGPFIYVCFIQLFILLAWRSNPVGIVATCTMAAGDGMADLIGRRYGRDNKWWFSESKSVAGTLAFVVSSFLVSFGLLQWLCVTGCMDLTLGSSDLALRVALISAVSAIVELLEFVDDNYSVPITAGGMAALLIR